MPSLFIAHRANTIHRVYELYHKHGARSVEIDVQPCASGELIVYNKNASRAKFGKGMVTLDTFLRYIPDDMLINVELKRYDARDMVDDVVKVCEFHRGKRYLFSSFDLDYCKKLKKKKVDVILLHEYVYGMKQSFQNIGVHVGLLAYVKFDMYDKVYVWGLRAKHAKTLSETFRAVDGWIVDYE
jgi:glycerophosphoryl diester phosphodiesterase